MNNTRLMSAWPVRGGLTLANGKLYAAAGVFPEQGVYLAALDPATGAPAWVKDVPHTINVNLFADGNTLWTPTHRTAPFQGATGLPTGATTTEYRYDSKKRPAGHIALQGHGKGHRPTFRKISIKPIDHMESSK